MPLNNLTKSNPDKGQDQSLDESWRNEAALLRMIEQANEGIWIMDTSFRVCWVNARACGILGYPREDILGKTPFDFLANGQTESVMKLMEKAREGPLPVIHERQFHHRDGSIIWALVNSSILTDSSGHHTGYLGMFMDITERKKAEQALRESEEKYHLLVENANEGIIVAQDETIRFANKRTAEITGYSIEELVSSPFIDLIQPEDRKLVMGRYHNRLKGKKPPALYEFRILRKDSNSRWVDISSVLISWEGRPATLNFLTDVTERKKTEEKIKSHEQRFWAEREQFTRKLIQVQEEERKRIARELHDGAAQNLALILLEIDRLENSCEGLSERAAFSLARIREEIERTQQDIRRYSHELRPGVLDYLGLEAALESLVTDMNSRNMLNANIRVEGRGMRLPDNMELALFRIAQEAMTNVWKHAAATRAEINLIYDPKRISLAISDNGKGFKVSPKTMPSATGGLGLIGMRERAQLIGADLRIKSAIGKGTSIFVKVPLQGIIPEKTV